eukprot:TRINITY_DN19496_c0_g1_i1.p1 TRINITY_DN19496_c0_g1~~TRINITY_DN19496_c0_g1_i1.p1  ORF type:complete len:113 (-),score=39.82 TRINITY_DN19496_c0_g1_i1:351-689(-)
MLSLANSARLVLSKTPACNIAAVRLMSGGDAPQRFGHSNGDSGWRWDKGGVGMGGKEKGPATEIKEGLGKGKDYENPEFFEYNKYSYFDIEKDMVDSKKRQIQPESNLTEFW